MSRTLSFLLIAHLLVACEEGPKESTTTSTGPLTTTDTPESCLVIDVVDLGTGGTLVAGCYLLNSELEIKGAVTFEDGVEIYVASDVWIEVHGEGSLVVAGSTVGVLLQGQAAGPAAWNGIRLEGPASLDKLTLSGACQNPYGDEYGALMLSTGGEVTGSDLTVDGCPQTGIRSTSDDAPFQLDGVSVTGAAVPAHLTFDQAGGLSGDVALREAPVQLWGTYVVGDVVLPALSYETTVWDVVIEGSLTLVQGTELAMHENAEISVTDAGQLHLLGTAKEPVIIRGQQEVRGYWEGIVLRPGLPEMSVLEHVVVADAGGELGGVEYTQAAIHVDDSPVSLSNVTVLRHAGFALSIEQETTRGTVVRDSRFADGERGVALSAAASGVFDDSNTVEGNDADELHIMERFFVLEEDTMWSVTTVPYWVHSDVSIEGALTIDAGVSVMFDEEVGLDVRAAGQLQVGDLAGDEVILGASNANLDRWKGIQFDSSPQANELVNVRMSAAGSGWNSADRSEASVYLDDSVVHLDTFAVQNSAVHDVYAHGESTVTCTNVSATIEGSVDSSLCAP